MPLPMEHSNITRVLWIEQQQNSIDLSRSYCLVNGKKCYKTLALEIITLRFSTTIANETHHIDIDLIWNEVIDDLDIILLQTQLGITIAGDGSCIEILDCNSDFTISVHQKNTICIDTKTVKDGIIHIGSQQTQH